MEVLVEDYGKFHATSGQCEGSAVAIAWGSSPPRAEEGVASVSINSLPREAGYLLAPAVVLCWATSPQIRPWITRLRAREAGPFQCLFCFSKCRSSVWIHRPAPGPRGPLCYLAINIHVFWLCEYPTGVSLQVSQWFDRAPPCGRQAPLDQGMPSEKVRACRDHPTS